MFGLGWPEIVIIAVVVLLIFGPKKIPEFGAALGKTLRGFKEERQEIVAKTNSQKWMCLETEYITTSGPLTAYQRRRGINTSKRKRIS